MIEPGRMREAARACLIGATDEGLRLFFPLAALHSAVWPALWALLWAFGLPLAASTAPAHWHGQEMLIGAYGASLIGFLTSALPEWTDSRRLRGRPLLWLAGLWGVARLVGFLGADAAILAAGIADQVWLLGLVFYVAVLSWRRRTTGFLAFLAFLALLGASAGALRLAMVFESWDLAERALRLIALAYLGLLGLALARISVPISNAVLDPSETTSPFRPHPGRRHLAPGLVGLVAMADVIGLSTAAQGFLLVAAGAAFLDRVAEGFIGRAGVRAEVLCLTATSAVTGAGLLLWGGSALDATMSASTALHVVLMGGLGLGVLSVLSIAGLRHMQRPLRFAPMTKAAFLLLCLAVFLRVTPDAWPELTLPGGPHGATALVWLAAWLCWAAVYAPLLWSPERPAADHC